MPGRNIFGEGFKKYAAEQIAVRQSKLAKSNKYDTDTLRFINNNTSWVRLASGVDVSLDRAKLLNTNLAGADLAKNYILYSARFGNNFTSGIGYNSLSTSYGFLSTPEYGLVPPPGIISAEIKPMNDKGTLRIANVQIICHNLPQFKIIEALYLRLKYTMLLEWGHTVFYANDSTLRSFAPDYALNGFLNGSHNQDTLITTLENAREQTSGNYDGFFGWVRNFYWTLKPEGGYDINLEMISLGDTIESLKLNTNYPQPIQATTSATESDTAKPPVIANKNKSTIHQILFAIKTELDAINYMDGFNAGGRSSLQGAEIVRLTKQHSQYDLQGINYIDPEEKWDTANHILTYQEGVKMNFPQLQTEKDSTDGFFYFIKLGALLRIIESFLLKYDTSKGAPGKYLPLFKIDHNYDTNLCLTLPRQISTDPRICVLPSALPPSTGGSDPSLEQAKASTSYTKLSFKNTTEEISGLFNDNDYIDQSTELVTGDTPGFDESKIITDYRFVTEKQTNVSGSEVDRLIEIVVQYKDGGTDTFDAGDDNIGPFYKSTTEVNTNNEVLTQNKDGEVSTAQNFNNITGLGTFYRVDGDEYAFLGKFMHIHVNLDFISRLLSDNIDSDGKISVYKFLEELMEGIQGATGHLNDYRIMYDEQSNTFYISDSNTLPNADKLLGVSIIPTVINAHVLKDNLGSFVTNVSLKSDLNNNYATMISVGAQSNGNVVGENATAFSRWNVGYEDRIVKDRSSVIDQITQESGSKSPEQVYVDNLLKYGLLNNLINSGQVTTEDITNNSQAVVDMLKYEIAYFTQNNNIQGQGFLPINLQLTMLGLSGPRLFESYTINETLLPDSYKNNIKFLTKGITHKVDTNGWTTTLDSFSGPRLDSLNKAVFYWPPEQEIAVNSTAAGGGGGGAGTNANVKGCATFSNYPDAPWTPSSVGSKKPQDANPVLLARRKQGIGNGNSSGLVSVSSRGNVNIITNEASLLYPTAADGLNKWMDEISAAGLCFTISSVFRTYAMQEAVARKYASQPGKAAAPGTSAHGDGIAIDIRELYRLVNGSTSGAANAQARTTKQYRYISYVGAKYGWYNPARLQGSGRSECWHFEYWGNA